MPKTKKILSMIIITIIFCLSLSCLFSCGNGLSPDILETPLRRLDAPGGLRIDNGYLLWNPVEYASRYLVSIDGNETYAEEYRYSLADVADGDHVFKVRAMGDGVVYESSDYSLSFEANLIGGSKAESGYYYEFDDLAKNESFLGYGFDVIRSSVFSDKYVIMSNPIFNSEDLMNQRLLKVDSKVTYVDEIESYSIEEFMQQWNVSANVNVSWGKKKIGGSADVEAAYSGGSESTTSKYFHCISFNNQKFYIVMQGDMDSYRNMLTEGFKKDLYSNMEPSKLFELYGTHFITSAVMGGRINSYYLYTSEEDIDFHDVSAKVSVDVRYLAGKTDVGVEGGYRSYAESKKVDVKNTFEVVGGGDFGMYSDTDIQTHYVDWEKSLDSHASLIGIKDSGSLRAIWELIDPALDTEIYTWSYERIDPETKEVIRIQGEGNRAAQLEAFFYAYGLDSYNDLMVAAELPEIVVAESIENITVNDKGADLRGEYKVLSGIENEIDFSYFPANATNVNKSVSLAEDYNFARINSRGNLVIDYDVENGTVIELILSVGAINERIKVRITKTSIVEFVTNWDEITIDRIENVEYGSQIFEPELKDRPGHTFAGWYTSCDFIEDTLYRFGDNAVKKDVTLYAKWVRKNYEVKFVNNYSAIKEDVVKVEYNGKLSRPDTPNYYGYTFVGWYTDSEYKEVFNFDNAIVDNTTIYVKWDINKYNITFDSCGGPEIPPLNGVEHGSKIVRPNNPKKSESIFIGWFEDLSYTNEFDFSTEVVESDMTLYAKWGINTIVIHFETMCDVEVYDRNLEAGTIVGELPEPKRAGYDFVSWHTNEDLLLSSKVYTDTIFYNTTTLYAKWNEAEYVVTFNGNGGTCETQSKKVVYTETYGDLPTPERIGYTFVGWYTTSMGGAKISSQTVVDIVENSILYALWENNKISIKYDINSSGLKGTFSDSIIDEVIYEQTTSIFVAESVTYAEYYIFDGWYTAKEGGVRVADSYGDLLKNVSGYTDSKCRWIFNDDVTLYARWSQTYIGYTYIDSPTELQNIEENGKYIILKDIDLEGIDWTPIPSFSGELDGNGNTIRNLYINYKDMGAVNSELHIGLFAKITSSAKIYDLNMCDASVYWNPQHEGDGWVLAGIVVGCADGTLENIKLHNCEIVINRDKSQYGGITGKLIGGEISSCHIYGIHLSGNGDTGGIAGCLVNGKIKDCSVEASSNRRTSIKHIPVYTRRSVGGICGFSDRGTIINTIVCSVDFLLENGLNLETNMGEVVGNLSNGTLHYANTYDITKNWVGEMYNYNFDYRTHWFAMEKGYVGCLEGDNDIK